VSGAIGFDCHVVSRHGVLPLKLVSIYLKYLIDRV